MIIVDTEANGLTKPEVLAPKEQPSCFEFAGIKLDDKTLKEKGRLEFMCSLPKGEMLDPKVIEITGVKDEELKGLPKFRKFVPDIIDFFFGEKFFLAHNVGYDSTVLFYEIYRANYHMKFPWPPTHICTAEFSRIYTDNNSRLKLKELHEFLFGEEHETQHRAMGDAEALTRCIIEMIKRGDLIL